MVIKPHASGGNRTRLIVPPPKTIHICWVVFVCILRFNLSMKIYFAGSIRGGRDDRALYLSLIEELQTYGTVLTEHIGDQNLSVFGDAGATKTIYERDMDWLGQSDVVVAEVSTPSLGVGYELGKAEGQKPILCLYRPRSDKSLSAMVSGNPTFPVFEYQTLEEVKLIFKQFFSSLPATPSPTSKATAGRSA